MSMHGLNRTDMTVVETWRCDERRWTDVRNLVGISSVFMPKLVE